ncbi:hypothetical protein DFH09DRAFT_1305821 [Mycena vulgaris]|nr:hypothetical protein DFH09DRAFT_1305821 [Mycena vulgaris]
MPTLLNGTQLQPSQYPTLFTKLLTGAMMILHGGQLRADSGAREEAIQRREELVRFAYNQAPFDSQYWDALTKVLDYWTRLSHDSNAKQIGVDILFTHADCCYPENRSQRFSIFPSEICDERTAPHLGWFNAARHSSMLPENLIGCACLYDFYTDGMSEGDYSHTAHVVLGEVHNAPAGTPLNKSAPSLMDLIHEENIFPSSIDKEALEELLFNVQPPRPI